MSTTAIISIITFVICIVWAIIRLVKNFKSQSPDKITLIKGNKEITISNKITEDDRRKLAHF